MEDDVFQPREYNGEVYKSSATDGAVNHSGDGLLNGYSNGIEGKADRKEHREESRDKHKHKHKDKDRDREKDKHRDKDRERDKHRDKDHKSSGSHKSKDRDKERSDKDRADRDKEKEKHKDKDRHREKDKEHKSSSSSNKEKDRSSSKHGSSSTSRPEKDKEREKHKSSNKDKDRSERDKEKSEKDRDRSDKDKHREKEKHRDKEKSKHSTGSREKDKEKKESASSDKIRHSSSGDSSKEKVKKQILQDSDGEGDSAYASKNDSSFLKEEPDIKNEIKEEPDSFSSHIDSTFDESRVKSEPESEEDLPLSARSSAVKREMSDEDEDDIPLGARKKVKKEKESKKRKKGSDYEDNYEEDFKPQKKKSAKKSSVKTEPESSPTKDGSPSKKKKKEDEQEVWKWWEEEKKDAKQKWNFLEHKGPVFAPPYEPLPKNVKFYYEGKEMSLQPETEEVATFYARMLEHDYVTKEAFNKNFFKDWRKVMTSKERDIITDLSKCNFKHMHAYFVQKSEERKAMSKEEKKAIKEKNEELVEEYGFCTIDGHKEKIGNFRLEPPGLFRGRGEHPKMGMLKKRLNAEDIIINCSKDSEVPQPPEGRRWKEVRHDNTVTWLASWTENVQGQVKYIMLNPSSKLKGEKDWQKYETARKLAKSIDKIRREYREDWKSKEMRIRQRAVALYFIDILALRAGNEKDEDQADTVGCCSLRVEHIQLHEEKDGKEYVVVFDFLGKDSIRYYNEVPVEKRVFKNVQLFMEGKKPNDDLFDRLNTQILNKHLNELMEGLTAKVFRTYNASWTLQQQLKELTNPEYSVPEMILAYNRANRAVAILCNHQRSIPKSHQKSMDNLKGKIAAKKEAIDEAERQYKFAKRDAKGGSAKEHITADKAKKKLERLREQLTKLEVQETDREENKTIALGTSKLNYLDPRISVAWCKKYKIPIEKIYNKTQRMKFRWAIDMAGPEYVF